MTGNDFGRATEARFLVDAHIHGLLVSRPFAELAGYDCVVDTGSRLFRVQIKGARPFRRRLRSGNFRSPQHSFTFKESRSFDIFAGWIDGEGSWLFLPATRCRSRQILVATSSPCRRGIDDWDIFRR